jgi:potassium-transporting ATPase KdpC subunit
MFVKTLKTSIIALVLFTVITGVLYPVLVTGLAQVLFPERANGSILRESGKSVGSELIGQPFVSPKYFWSRPSATAPYPYNAGASAGSNFGPLNPALADAAANRVRDLRSADPGNSQLVPVDLVTTSGSGLDPHISVAAAIYQIPRVARERKLERAQVTALVEKFTDHRQFGFLGEPRVNVLQLNLELDKTPSPSREN